MNFVNKEVFRYKILTVSDFADWLTDAMYDKGRKEKRKYKQKDLARDLRVAQSLVSAWVNDKQSPGHYSILKLAEFFKVSTLFIYEKLGKEPPTFGDGEADDPIQSFYKLDLDYRKRVERLIRELSRKQSDGHNQK